MRYDKMKEGNRSIKGEVISNKREGKKTAGTRKKRERGLEDANEMTEKQTETQKTLKRKHKRN